jgi:hypothetical protein
MSVVRKADSWKEAGIQRGLESGGRGIAVVRNRYQERSINKLRTLMCVCVCNSNLQRV